MTVSAKAAKQRRYRQTVRERKAFYQVKLDERVLLAILRSGRLTEEQCLDRKIVADDLADILLQWSIKLWRV